MGKKIIVPLMIFFIITIVFATNLVNAQMKLVDMPDDWSNEALEHAYNNGLITGYNNRIMPDKNLTRAEMATIINRAFKAENMRDISEYKDVSINDWYYEDMQKAVGMKTFQGSNNNLNPKDFITREEAFLVITRAFKISPSDIVPNGYTDIDNISTWAKSEVCALINQGYISGYDGKINPKNTITRKEFAQVMYNVVKQYIDEPGKYNNVDDGNVLINVPNVTLNDLIVTGDLIIGDGVGEGDVTLNNVVVEGRTVIRGGGVNSIIVKGASKINHITVSKSNGAVRVKVEEGSGVEVIYIDDGKDDVIIEGEVGDVNVDTEVPITFNNANVNHININTKKSNVTVSKTTVVHDIKVKNNATESNIKVEGKVSNVTVEAENTEVNGEGEVENVEIHKGGNNTKVKTKETNVKISSDVKGVTGLNNTPLENGKEYKNAKDENDEIIIVNDNYVEDDSEENIDDEGNQIESEVAEYTVNYYKQDTRGNSYSKYESESEEETVGSTVVVSPKENEGYTYNSSKSTLSGTVLDDDSLVLSIYYDINTHSVNYYGNGGSGNVSDSQNPYAYEENVRVMGNAFFKNGYTFSGWNTKPDGSGTSYGAGSSFEMGDSNVNLYAMWEIRSTPPTPIVQKKSYTIEHYIMNDNENYVLDKTESKLAIANTEITGQPLTSYENYKYDASIENNVISGTNDGSLVLKFYYEKTYNVIYDANTGNGRVSDENNSYLKNDTVKIVENTFTKEGYHFIGWSEDQNAESGSYIEGDSITIGTEDILLYAIWEADEDTESSITFYSDSSYTNETSSFKIGDIVYVKVIDTNEIVGGDVSLNISSSYDLEGIDLVCMDTQANNCYTGMFKISEDISSNGTQDILANITVQENSSNIINVKYSELDEEIELPLVIPDNFEGNIIKGIITLPDNEIAPNGGIKIRMTISKYQNSDSNSFLDVYFSDVIIPEGENYIEYLYKINDTNVSYKIDYGVYSIKSEFDYPGHGYYSANGMVANVKDAAWIEVSENEIRDINVKFGKGQLISGVITLPSNEVVSETETRCDVYITGCCLSKTFIIPPGQESINYQIRAYKGEQLLSYRYYINENSYVKGYYNSLGTGRNTHDAELVVVDGYDLNGINMDILDYNTISGTISLPDNETAPIDGMRVDIVTNTINYTENKRSSVIIPEGENSVEYTVGTYNGDYKITYLYSYNGKNFNAEYNEQEYVGNNSSNFTEISVTENNITGIDFKIINTNIKGTVSLPNEEVAPDGGINLRIIAVRNGILYREYLIIPAGKNSVGYTIYVPEGSYQISYLLLDMKENYIEKGYYSSMGTVSDSEYGEEVSVGLESNLTEIDLEVIKGNIISGEISLPDGEVAPEGGVSVKFNCYDDNYAITDSVMISEGLNSVIYAYRVPKGNYRVYYDYFGDDNYIDSGWYTSEETVNNFFDAETVEVKDNDLTNIDLSLIKLANTISGTISLPEGEVAPREGIEIQLYANNYNKSITIPKGSSRIEYSINVLDGDYKIRYNCKENENYVKYGYYTSTEVIANSSNAEVLEVNGSDITGIDFTLLKGNMISGTISLPEGEAASKGGVDVQLCANNYNKCITIPEGKSSTEYSFRVLDGIYKIEYFCQGNGIYNKIGYYTSKGIVWNSNEAELVDIVGRDVTEIDFTLVKGNMISGTISLPEGEVVPEGGLKINLYADEVGLSYNSSTYITIPEGSSTIDYSISVLDGNYKIKYNCQKNKNYAKNGYYTSTKVVASSSEAETFEVSGNDIVGMDFTLLKGNTICGTISLPEGEVAPEGGLNIHLYLPSVDHTYSSSTSVMIPAGANNAEYTIKVLNGDYKIRYNYNESEKYANIGYYTSTGIVARFADAEIIEIDGNDKIGIDFSLEKGNIISGKISLPEGELAPKGGIEVTIDANPNDYNTYRTSITVPEGINSMQYIIRVLDGNYTINYYFPDNEAFYKSGYYTSTGVVRNSYDAEIIEVEGKDIMEVDFIIIK